MKRALLAALLLITLAPGILAGTANAEPLLVSKTDQSAHGPRATEWTLTPQQPDSCFVTPETNTCVETEALRNRQCKEQDVKNCQRVCIDAFNDQEGMAPGIYMITVTSCQIVYLPGKGWDTECGCNAKWMGPNVPGSRIATGGGCQGPWNC